MSEADYTEALPEAVTMAFAPLRAFGDLLCEYNVKGVSLHPMDVGVVLAALTDYSQSQLADILNVVEAKVGKVKVGFVGDTSSIADKVVDAALAPAPKQKARATAVVPLTPAKEEDAHHG
jgi:hypothetical protein